jgi:hypothetical protein
MPMPMPMPLADMTRTEGGEGGRCWPAAVSMEQESSAVHKLRHKKYYCTIFLLLY